MLVNIWLSALTLVVIIGVVWIHCVSVKYRWARAVLTRHANSLTVFKDWREYVDDHLPSGENIEGRLFGLEFEVGINRPPQSTVKNNNLWKRDSILDRLTALESLPCKCKRAATVSTPVETPGDAGSTPAPSKEPCQHEYEIVSPHHVVSTRMGGLDELAKVYLDVTVRLYHGRDAISPALGLCCRKCGHEIVANLSDSVVEVGAGVNPEPSFTAPSKVMPEAIEPRQIDLSRPCSQCSKEER